MCAPRHGQHALTDYVARHLHRAAPDAAALAHQEIEGAVRRGGVLGPRRSGRVGHLEGQRTDPGLRLSLAEAHQRGGLIGQLAPGHALGDAGGHLLADQLEHARLADQIAHGRVVHAAGLAGDGVHGARVHAAGGRPHGVGHVRRRVEHALVEHPTDAHGPPVVDRAHPVGVRHDQVGEELLAELTRAVEHLNAVDLDGGLVDREDEHAEAAVFGHVPVGASEAQAPVGPPRACRPYLGPVQHPLVPVAHGGGERARDVRTPARLGEELHPQFIPAQDGRNVLPLLLLGAELEQHGGARRERRDLDPARVLVPGQLLVQHLLVHGGQTLPAVLAREAETCQPGVEERPLQLALVGDLRQLLLLAGVKVPAHLLHGDLAEVGLEKLPHALAKALEVLQLTSLWYLLGTNGTHAAASSRASMREAMCWRWVAGVPASARLAVKRRRKR